MCYCVILIFFFKQKTAYDMRISDWSSDVCSSDLECGTYRDRESLLNIESCASFDCCYKRVCCDQCLFYCHEGHQIFVEIIGDTEQIGRASCREGVCQYV